MPVPPLPPLQLANSSTANAGSRNGNINFAPYPVSVADEINGFAGVVPQSAGMLIPGVLLAVYLLTRK